MGKQQVKLALELVGNQHKYQKILVLLICLSWIEFDFVLLGSTLIYANPLFYCEGIQQKLSEASACPIINTCHIIDSFTLTSQLKLYCELQWARDLIQSIFPFGSILGLFCMNLLSDIKGRKISTVICLCLTTIGVTSNFFVITRLVSIIGGYYKSMYMIFVAQLIAGFGIFPLISLSYSLLSDFCSDKFKPRAVIIVNTAWSASTVILGYIYILEIDWFHFLLFIILIPLIIVTYFMQKYLNQPPFILMDQNKKQQTLQILLKIAKINNTYDQNHQKIQQIINNQQVRAPQDKASLKNVFRIILKKQDFLKTIIIMAFIRTIGAVNFYGTSYAFATLGLGLGYNSMLAGMMELLAFLFLTFTVNKLPRRKGMSAFYFVVFCIGFLFFFPFASGNQTNATILMSVSRFFSTVAYTLIASSQTQAFTYEIQSTAVGFVECFGLFGGMLGPIIVDFADKIGINPNMMISLLVSCAVWLPYFLKQTLIIKEKTQLNKNLLNPQQASDSLITQDKQIQNNYNQQSQTSILTRDQQ